MREALRGPGVPIDARTRKLMENRLGWDFSHVRVHTDERAAASARAVNALAYTVGSSIVFSSGRYAPHTDQGQHLLVHELVHTVQQGRRETPLGGQRLSIEWSASPAEDEARMIAASELPRPVRHETPELRVARLGIGLSHLVSPMDTDEEGSSSQSPMDTDDEGSRPPKRKRVFREMEALRGGAGEEEAHIPAKRQQMTAPQQFPRWFEDGAPKWDPLTKGRGTAVHVILGPKGGDSTNRGSPPGGNQCMAVDKLNKDLPEDIKKKGHKWFKGHLLNEELGGPGITENLTPVINKQNTKHSSRVEAPIKSALSIFRARWQYHRKDPYWYGVRYTVKVVDSAFPDSGDPYAAVGDYLECEWNVVKTEKSSGARTEDASGDEVNALELPYAPTAAAKIHCVGRDDRTSLKNHLKQAGRLRRQ